MPEPQRKPVRHPRKRKMRFPWLFFLILLVGAMLLYSLIRYSSDTRQLRQEATEPPTEAVTATIGDTITIAAAGDIHMSTEILHSAVQPDGSFDFTPLFMEVSPLLSDADLTVANLEVNITEGAMTGADCKAPKSLLTALRGAGIDLVQTANTNSVYNGLDGLTSTCAAVEEVGLYGLGTYASGADFKKSGGYTLVEVDGFRVAFVAFTKGVGNLRLPEGAEDCVNLLYTDYNTTYQKVDTEGIQAVLDSVNRERPDITIAMLHWGSEYETDISDTQKRIEALLLDNGVDAILGTHPHILGQVKQNEKTGSITAYSLGNLLATEEKTAAKQSMVLKLEFTRTEKGVKLTSWSYTPIYIATAAEAGKPQILDIRKALELYSSGYFGRVSDELYQSLLAAVDKIPQRVEVVAE